MMNLLLLSCFLGLALAGDQPQLCYTSGNGQERSCMNVELNQAAHTIHFHMAESGDFEDVDTLEDYKIGLAASRVESQEACYVRRLVKSFADQVAYIENNKNQDITVKSDLRVSAVSLDNPDEEIGSDLANFCGDLPVYKMLKEEQQNQLDRRQVNITFRRCVLLCFIPTCFVTTLTLPTGSTITFGWLFFG